MQKQMTLLVFSASPDSAEIMAGGTLIKYAKFGHKIFDVIVNKVEPTSAYGAYYHDVGSQSSEQPESDIELKKKEQKKAGEIIGYQEVRFLDYEDIESDPQKKWSIVDIIREIRPDIILTHFENNRNLGFAHTLRIVKEASFLAATGRRRGKFLPHRIKMLYMFGIRGWAQDFIPDVFIDISDVIEKKKEALSQYKSMWGLPGRSKDYWLERHVLTQNKQWAFEAGIPGFAEAFKSYWTRLYGSPLADEFLPCREGGNL